ncbi:hypothetical protein HY621_01505 [Candidatus Uhrbacteria bacterium]|nr:hypothetical protein [Candidatus Uhrbacteria bacterium]
MTRLRLSLLFSTLALFGLAQGTAVFIASQAPVFVTTDPFLFWETESAQTVFFQFLILFFTATAALLILLHLYKGRALYRFLFLFVVFLGLMKLFLLVFPPELSLLVSALFLCALFLLPAVWVHNMVVIAAAVGIGPIFGLQFHFLFAALLLLALSVYDIIAVYITKHMILLAHELIRRQASFALFVPDTVKKYFAQIRDVQPGSGFLIVGGGDIVLPMIFSASLVRASLPAAIASVAGMLVGITLNHLLIVSRHHPIPALPLITIGALGGAFAALGIY